MRKSTVLIHYIKLKLKKTTKVSVVDRKFTMAVFDKRDGFSYCQFPSYYMDSNIPSKSAYGIYILQFVV